MKIKRKTLLIIIASLGIFLVFYSLFRHFTGIGLEEGAEKFMMDAIIISALGLYIYNRKMAKDERLAREAAPKTECRLPEEPEEQEEASPVEDEDRPHWER